MRVPVRRPGQGGFYLFYPERRHASPVLRALVDYLRRTKRPVPRSLGR